MNKSLIYTVAGIVAVVVIAAIVFFINQPGSPMMGGGAPTSMKALLAQGGSQQCTFSSAEDGAESSGVIFVAGGKMRGDFTSVSGGQSVESHMITDGTTAYIWTNQMPQGIKMSFGAMNDSQAGQGSTSSVDPDKEMDYRCSGWSTDQGKFTLPAGVTFTDLSAALGASAGASAGAGAGATPQCAQCNMISEPSAQAQCRAALGCN